MGVYVQSGEELILMEKTCTIEYQKGTGRSPDRTTSYKKALILAQVFNLV